MALEVRLSGEVLDLLGVPEIHPPLAPLEIWLAVGACSLFSYINYRGASETGKAANVVTIGKVVIIGAFVVAGLRTMGLREGWEASFTPFMPHGWTGIFAAMGLTFIAFEGYEIIAQTSEEVENAAFLIGFGALGIAFALAVGLGSAKAIQKGWETLFDRDRGK